MLGSLIGVFARNVELDAKVRFLRTALKAIAIGVVGLAVRLYLLRSFPGWPIVLALGIAVWLTSRSKDVVQIFLGFEHYAQQMNQVGLRESARQMIRTRQSRRRLQQALQQERGEADDAARLDQVLNQLHSKGAESLSKQDRELLKRVSERVRKERDADSSSG